MRISQNFKGLLVIISGMAISGCTVVARTPGPPGYAPAVGYSSHYDYYDDYYYYPSARVYFHIYTGYYYYLSGNRWVRSRVLPRHIRLHSNDRYRLRIKDRYPYLRDHEYRNKYRPRRTPKVNERDDLRERELNNRRFDEYRQRGDGRRDDRYRDNMRNQHEENRDPRRELLLRKKPSDQGNRPELRGPGNRDERVRDQDRRRDEKRTHKNKKRDEKSKKQSDSEDKDDDRKSNDNRNKDPRSILLR